MTVSQFRSYAVSTRMALVTAILFAAGCTVNDRQLDSTLDPVCGKVIEQKSAVVTRSFLRKTYCFDSEDCAHAFDAHPARYCDVASTMYPNYDY